MVSLIQHIHIHLYTYHCRVGSASYNQQAQLSLQLLRQDQLFMAWTLHRPELCGSVCKLYKFLLYFTLDMAFAHDMIATQLTCGKKFINEMIRGDQNDTTGFIVYSDI